MTKQIQTQNDPRYAPYLDHGFVGLLDHMGSDEDIEFAARMSYGEETRSVSDRRGLIRYLVRNWHTSPIEMGEVKFHLKMPIAVMRQLVRHRTASLNEYSARYSVLTDEFYLPRHDQLKSQSETNKQGSGRELDIIEADFCRTLMEESYNDSHAAYRALLDAGLTREAARLVMPVGGYTEVVWKIDLKNFFNTVKLRSDRDHAQDIISDVSDLMYGMVQPLFPLTCEAFEDYWLNGVSLSTLEIAVIRRLLDGKVSERDIREAVKNCDGGFQASEREIKEFIRKVTRA